MSVADAVRAAVSEVEDYQRIDIGETSDDQVLSAVGSDLIHMVAEIVDNALSYSPPDQPRHHPRCPHLDGASSSR